MVENNDTPPSRPVSSASIWATLGARLRAVVRNDGVEGTLARGALWTFAVNCGGTLLAFLVQMLLARTLGPIDYGIYIYVLGWLNVAVLVGKYEWDFASLRFLSAYVGQSKWSLLRGFLRRSDLIVAIASMTVAGLCALLTWLLRERLGSPLMHAALAACLLLPITAFLQVKSLALQGLKRVLASQVPVSILRPLLFALGLLVVLSVGRSRPSAELAILINVGASGATLLLSALLLRRTLPPEVSRARPGYETRHWMRTAGGMLLISGAQLVVSQNFDIVVVGTMLGTTVAGYYGAAAQLAVLVHFGVNAVLFMAAPLISELYARDDRAGLQRLVTLTARMNLALSVPVIVGLLIGGRLALSWYGPSMVAGYPVLVVLLVGQLAGTGVGSLAGFLMTMTGHQNRAAVIIGASAVLYLVLAAVLTHMFGAVGTASATVIALLVRGIALDIEVRRLLGLEASAFGRHRPLATAQASAGFHAPEPEAHADAQPVISR